MRTARSITSGEYRTDFFMVAPFSQMLEPPSNPGRFTRKKHIFSEKSGHIRDTPQNRKLLEDLANDATAKVATDRYGNSWYARVEANGKQVWAEVRGERIIGGGINSPPRQPHPDTGLSAPRKSRWMK
ncbi:filamentous hemagglutinin family protein [Duganella radicis]|uniref:Filamentous hemagglutinin family protein n=2 Tax=Duganella radicis TaxID=551988 RepID=A0A6L6PSH3_9BURK|nr:filamentous hemagglutinin family protein [Duganella radicis]